jgi:hypothetical protein
MRESEREREKATAGNNRNTSDATMQDRADLLGDFTTNWRVLTISGIAVSIGVASAFVALALLRLIGLFTNLFFFQRLEHRARFTCRKSAWVV